MIVYVAGASAELERAAWAMRAVEDAGHQVAWDWVKQILEVGLANPEADDEQRRLWADKELTGVDRSTAFWLLVPTKPTSGCWVELGYWLRADAGRPYLLIMSGPGRYQSIFTAYAHHHFETDEHAAAWLRTQRLR